MHGHDVSHHAHIMPLGSGSGSFAAEVAIIKILSTLHEKDLLLSARSVVGIGLVAIAWDGGFLGP
jgi:hypothetical protein